MNVTGSSEDFALFDFSQNKLRAFPNFYFEKVPEILILNLTGNNFRKVPQAVAKSNHSSSVIHKLQQEIRARKKFTVCKDDKFTTSSS